MSLYGKPNRYRVQHKGRKPKTCRHYSNPKKIHQKHTKAIEAAVGMMERHRDLFLWFPCDHCRGWHVGRIHLHPAFFWSWMVSDWILFQRLHNQ